VLVFQVLAKMNAFFSCQHKKDHIQFDTCCMGHQATLKPSDVIQQV